MSKTGGNEMKARIGWNKSVVVVVLLVLVLGELSVFGEGSAERTFGTVKMLKMEEAIGAGLPVRMLDFSEVEIAIDGDLTVEAVAAYGVAPGSDLEVLEGGSRVRVQLSSESVESLVVAGAEVEVIRRFVLVESVGDEASVSGGEVTTLSTCSGPDIYGESGLNVYIEDNTSWYGSGLDFSGASGGEVVSCIDVHYEVRDLWAASIVDVSMSEADYDMYTLESGWWGGDGDILGTRTGISYFVGEAIDQVWVLWAADYYADGWGYIDYWWIKLYYEDVVVPGYCAAGSVYCNYEYIANVDVGDISNASGCSNYGDYTSFSTEMNVGDSYGITVTNGCPYDEYDDCGVWVDWNGDDDFDDVSESISMSADEFDEWGGVITFVGTITVPGDANIGDTRMRIRVVSHDTMSSCGVTAYGEVEDYTASISGGDNGIIGGIKFNDLNKDGDQDAGEPGIAGWEIYLDTNGNGQWNAGEPKDVTDGSGNYEFTGLAAGLYVVDEVHQAGWHQTCPANEGRYTETIDADDVLTGRDFGNRQISGTLVLLEAIEDTYASSANPDTNYGSSNSISSGRSSSSTYRGYVKFDMSSIPAGNVVTSAILRLDNNFISIPAPELDVYRTSDRWDESTLTWNDQPIESPPPGLLEINRSVVDGDVTTWDITREVDYDYVIDGFCSVKIESSDEGVQRWAGFWSTDVGWPPISPTLEVEYEPIFGGGSGEEDDPYQIWTGEQFNTIGLYPNRWSKNFKLMDNISLAGHTGSAYNRIGVAQLYSGDGPFDGVFDGDFHSISDFSYFAPSSWQDTHIALFGYVYSGTIKNLKVVAPDVYTHSYSQNYVGALAGTIERAHIFGCSIIGGSVDGASCVGGLIGLCKSSYLADCSSSASVSGSSGVGGLIGDSSPFGGFSAITDCYARGAVTGVEFVGGFVGDSSAFGVRNCYSTGLVSGDSNVGGFSGYNGEYQYPIFENVIECFWDVESSGMATSDAGTGKTTVEMQTENTFTDAGWDFVGEVSNGGSDDWAMPPGGGYPVLWHELAVTPPLPSFAGGSGTVGDPYLIATVDQLNSIAHNSRLLDKHFKVVNDLDLSGLTYHMIAPDPYVFNGVFDGNSHTISGIEPKSWLNTSSFGFIGGLEGSIRNLTLVDPNVVSVWGWGVGSLVGSSDGGSITNCHAVNANVEGLLGVGGLVGTNVWYGKISGCSVTGNVSQSLIYPITYSSVAGLVGENNFWGEIEDGSAICNVTGDDCVGGLVGTNVAYSTVRNCYSSGTVTGTMDYIGGLIARNEAGTETEYCYSSCAVTGPEGTDGVGALIGKMRTAGTEYYTSCFWDSDLNPGLSGIGNGSDPNVVGATTAEMQTESTFTDAGWDFVGEVVNGPNDVWDICEGTNYPRLAWSIPASDFLCPDGVNGLDFAYFASWWMEADCDSKDDCGGADLDFSGVVDRGDLKILCDWWLGGIDN